MRTRFLRWTSHDSGRLTTAVNWGVIGALVCISGLATLVTPVVERMWRRRFLSDRAVMSCEEIFQTFKDAVFDKEGFVRAWQEVASALHVDPGRLRPEDRLEDLRGVVAQLSIFSDLDAVYQLPGVRELALNKPDLTLADVVVAMLGK